AAATADVEHSTTRREGRIHTNLKEVVLLQMFLVLCPRLHILLTVEIGELRVVQTESSVASECIDEVVEDLDGCRHEEHPSDLEVVQTRKFVFLLFVHPESFIGSDLDETSTCKGTQPLFHVSAGIPYTDL
ncbi:hypothetical protein PMAYCL1PPCAC_30499, partial [Pristionchus mayeri]